MKREKRRAAGGVVCEFSEPPPTLRKRVRTLHQQQELPGGDYFIWTNDCAAHQSAEPSVEVPARAQLRTKDFELAGECTRQPGVEATFKLTFRDTFLERVLPNSLVKDGPELFHRWWVHSQVTKHYKQPENRESNVIFFHEKVGLFAQHTKLQTVELSDLAKSFKRYLRQMRLQRLNCKAFLSLCDKYSLFKDTKQLAARLFHLVDPTDKNRYKQQKLMTELAGKAGKASGGESGPATSTASVVSPRGATALERNNIPQLICALSVFTKGTGDNKFRVCFSACENYEEGLTVQELQRFFREWVICSLQAVVFALMIPKDKKDKPPPALHLLSLELSCRNLPRADGYETTSARVHMHTCVQGSGWVTSTQQTEVVKEEDSPEFRTLLKVPYQRGRPLWVRFTVHEASAPAEEREVEGGPLLCEATIEVSELMPLNRLTLQLSREDDAAGSRELRQRRAELTLVVVDSQRQLLPARELMLQTPIGRAIIDTNNMLVTLHDQQDSLAKNVFEK